MIVDRYRTRVYNIAYRMLRDRETAHDMAPTWNISDPTVVQLTTRI